MSQHAYETTEDIVGRAIKIVAKQSMKDALAEEIKLSKEAGAGTYETEQYGKLPSLTVSTDASWQRRASGTRYDSASGVVHFIGVRSGKVVDTNLTINRCQICDKIEKFKEKKRKAKVHKKDTKIQKYNSKLKNIKAHLCLKNFR